MPKLIKEKATKRVIIRQLGGLDNNLQRSIAIAVAEYSKGLSLTCSKIEYVHELLKEFDTLIDNDVCHNNYNNSNNQYLVNFTFNRLKINEFY